jgi:thiamine-monophosphate kinase
VLTSDPVIEGTHFEPGTPSEQIGHKAIARVLSDIAAMGGEPLWCLVDVSAPPSTATGLIETVYTGACALAERYGMAIVGGDTARSGKLALHVFAAGRVPRGSACLRSGAQPGDLLFVTGTLGGSRVSRRHMLFEPRVREGLKLRQWVTAMIDVSDGLDADLRHIATMSSAGARIQAGSLPVSKEALQGSGDLSALRHALYDGEDFELLFALPSVRKSGFLDEWTQCPVPVTEIGVVTAHPGRVEYVDESGEPVEPGGCSYEHFGAEP